MKSLFVILLLLLFPPSFVVAEDAVDPTFYRNDGENIEFRIVIEEDDKSPWMTLQDRNGSPQNVSKEVMIASEDVAGMTIENDSLIMHFKPDSWTKVRERTSKLIGKHMAFIKNR